MQIVLNQQELSMVNAPDDKILLGNYAKHKILLKIIDDIKYPGYPRDEAVADVIINKLSSKKNIFHNDINRSQLYALTFHYYLNNYHSMPESLVDLNAYIDTLDCLSRTLKDKFQNLVNSKNANTYLSEVRERKSNSRYFMHSYEMKELFSRCSEPENFIDVIKVFKNVNLEFGDENDNTNTFTKLYQVELLISRDNLCESRTIINGFMHYIVDYTICFDLLSRNAYDKDRTMKSLAILKIIEAQCSLLNKSDAIKLFNEVCLINNTKNSWLKSRFESNHNNHIVKAARNMILTLIKNNKIPKDNVNDAINNQNGIFKKNNDILIKNYIAAIKKVMESQKDKEPINDQNVFYDNRVDLSEEETNSVEQLIHILNNYDTNVISVILKNNQLNYGSKIKRLLLILHPDKINKNPTYINSKTIFNEISTILCNKAKTVDLFEQLNDKLGKK